MKSAAKLILYHIKIILSNDFEWFLEDLETLTVSNERNAEQNLNL